MLSPGRLRHAYGIVFIGLFAAVGYGIMLYGLIEGIVEFRLNRSGVETQGVITGKDSNKDSDGGQNTIRYKYKDAAEHPYFGSGPVDDDEYEKDQIGDSLTVYYVREQPDESRLTRHGGWWAMGFFGIPFALFGTLGLLDIIKKAARENRILKRGQRTLGCLVSVEKDTKLDSENQCSLTYSFTDPTGMKRTGKTDFFANSQEPYWRDRVGKPLVIYYLAEKISENIVEMDESKALRLE